MGRSIRIAGLSLVAAFALSALVAVDAEASTEFASSCYKAKKVGKFYTGHYMNKTCTEKASEEEITKGGKANKYEYGPAGSWAAKGTAVKIGSAAGEISCPKGGGSGKVIGPTRVESTFEFLGCMTNKHASCMTPHAAAGEIQTKLLLGAIGESAGKVLVSFTGKESGATEPAAAETFAEFECEGTLFKLHGTLAGTWTEAVNKTTKHGGIEFAAGAGQEGLIEQFFNAISNKTEEQAATLEGTQSFKFNVRYEIKQA
jgi:hypothetical protein